MTKKGFLKDCADIFTNRIWTVDASSEGFVKRRIVRFVKLIRITVETFAENRMGFQCVALSYFVALAVIPFAAFIFAISGGLGLSDKLYDLLIKLSPTNSDIVSTVMEKADNIIATAQSGTVGLIGALTFLWTIIWLMFQVERVFNNVWGLRKVPRKMYKRFSFYFGVLILSPFLVMIFGTGIVFYTNMTSLIGLDLGDVTFLPELLGWLGFFVVTAFTLSAMYKFIPATKVRYKYALKAALVAAAVFAVFQYIYLETQVFVARLNGVYGAIAAIPLFLIWMNFSWQIIIYGAELTYGYQNVDTYHIPEWDGEK